MEPGNIRRSGLTPENLMSPWLLFEAGAVAKRVDSRVWTYLFGLGYTDVKDPLSQFQHTAATKEDTRKLIATLNHRLGEGGHPTRPIDQVLRNLVARARSATERRTREQPRSNQSEGSN
jgi:hypothetical protein